MRAPQRGCRTASSSAIGRRPSARSPGSEWSAPTRRTARARSGRSSSASAAIGRSAGAVRALRGQPGVAYAYPDYVAHATGAFYPDDPGNAHTRRGWERMQWNMLAGTGVDAPQAWSNLLADKRAGGKGVVVAVLDTGVAYRDWGRFRISPDFRGTRFVAPVRLRQAQPLPVGPVGPRDVRRRRDRRADQQPGRSHRAGVRRLDHAGAGPERERRGRRVDDRRRDPLCGQARRQGDQPEPRVPARPRPFGRRRSR